MVASYLAKIIEGGNHGIQVTIDFLRDAPGDTVRIIHGEHFEGGF